MTSSFQNRSVTLETAKLRWQSTGEPFSEQFGDLYFSASGGLSESRYVFLEQNDLPLRLSRLRAKQVFTVAETGFGTGLNFLATSELWQRSGAQGWLHFVSFERYPLSTDDLEKALSRWPELGEHARMLAAQYPEPLAGVHRLVWPEYRIRLTLYFGDALAGLQSLAFIADAWYLDGFNPSSNGDLWNDALYRAIACHSDAKTTFATYSAAGAVRRGLAAAGFRPEKVAGHKPKREMLRGQFYGLKPESGLRRSEAPRRVVIVGAGVAGCLMAWNLARRGSEVILVEAGPGPAAGASGNLQGALYVKLGVDYSPQSELALAALVFAQRFYGSLDSLRPSYSAAFWHPTGLLQLATTDEEADRQTRFAERHRYPESILSAVSAAQATSIAGLSIDHPGLYFPGSGWLAPRELCRTLSTEDGIILMPNTTLAAYGENGKEHWVDLVPSGSGVDSSRRERITCDQLVLCPGASDLLTDLRIPARKIRGQISWWPTDAMPSPICVVCGDGYINPSNGTHVTLGATFDLRDDNPAVRIVDHQRNLDTVGHWLAAVDDLPDSVHALASGRTAFRCTTPDYQPLAGELYSMDALPETLEALTQPQTQRRGVAVFAGLGSKGLSYAPLLAEWLCDHLCGEVPALPSRLASLVHPQRFSVREAKHGKAPG